MNFISNTVRLGLAIAATFLITACSGENTQSSGSNSGSTSTSNKADVTEEVGENPTKPIEIKILGPNKTEPGKLSRYSFEATKDVEDQEWKIDDRVVSHERDLEISLEKGYHNISVNISGPEINGQGSKKVIVKDTIAENWVSIQSEINILEIESAQYYSIDSGGKIFTSKTFDGNDFHQTDKGLEIPLEVDIDEFYSHLTIYLKNGKSTAFALRDGEFEKLPLTMILKKVEESVDEMSGLHSLYFKINTSRKINPDQILSCKAIVNGKVIESNYDSFDDNTVYEWKDNSFEMKSFALGYEDSDILMVSLCLEVQAENDQVLVCSDTY